MSISSLPSARTPTRAKGAKKLTAVDDQLRRPSRPSSYAHLNNSIPAKFRNVSYLPSKGVTEFPDIINNLMHRPSESIDPTHTAC